MQKSIEFGSGDNTSTSTSSHPEPQHAPVNRVTMKPPPFFRTNPTVWFRQMESQLVSTRITNDTTKYHHILAAIPEDVAINLPIEIEDYSFFKIASLKSTRSQKQFIEEALGTISLDGQKPCVCLLRIQRKLSECHLTMDDDVIKYLLMQAKIAAFTCFSLTLPTGVSTGVSGLDQSPHTSNRYLAHNHPPQRETNNPSRVRGNDWGSHRHPPCRQNQLTEN